MLSQFVRFSSLIPNCSNIFLEVSFINGCNKTATILKFSTKWYITEANFSLSSSTSDFANVQGAVSSIYLLLLEIIFQISPNALLTCILSMFSSNAFTFSITYFSNSSSCSFLTLVNFGTTPSKYLFIIPIVLFNKFPKSLHKSILYLSTNPSGVNTPSCPYCNSFSKKYFVASNPYLSLNNSGYTIFPLDLDIFPSFIIIQPCAYNFLGNGKSSAIRNIGQYIP